MKNATLCYIERDGKILMMFRNKKPNDPNEGKWIGVGGKVEPGETVEQCARREILEETGLTVRELTAWGDVWFRSDVWEDEVMHLFAASGAEGELSECDEGELHWIEKDEVFSLRLWDGDRVFLKYLMQGVKFDRMELEYHGDRLCRCVVDGNEEELLDVNLRNGEPSGMVVSRDFVHWKGQWHPTVHVWLTGRDPQGKPTLLLQLRAAGKRLYPSHWDISAAGHIPAGERPLNGALRELEEELGVHAAPDDPVYAGVLIMTYDDDIGQGYHDREHCYVYLLHSDADESEFTLQASEVEKVMWMPFDELYEAVRRNTFHHCLFTRELDFIRPFIEGQL